LGCGGAFRAGRLIALSAVQDECVAENGKPVVVPVLRVCATFDHRVLDGMHAAKMSKTIRRIFANPEAELGPLPEAAPALPAATTT
jgi:pyruvate dehydrogenase E2 component (dihydrolipoamide acetyltransferase)